MKRKTIITLLVIALVIVCLCIGAVIFFAAKGGFPTNNPFDTKNIPSQLEDSQTLNVDTEKSLTLKVSSQGGDVTVTGAEVDTVQVKAIKTAYDSSQARADEEVKSIQYTLDETNGIITLKYEIAKSTNFSNNVNTVDFIVVVPNKITVELDTRARNVSVAEIQGDVDIHNSFGEIELKNIEGALTVTNSGGEVRATLIKAGQKNIEIKSDFGAVTLESASGKDIKLTSSGNAVKLTEVRATGDITTHNDFGEMTFENGSAHALTVESNNGKTSLHKLRVSQKIKIDSDFGEIELEQALAAEYDLQTKGGAITLNGAKGTLTAYTDFGDIQITNAEAATLNLKTKSGVIKFSGSLGEGPHAITSDFGEINLTIPADTQLALDLQTDFGKIKSDMPVTTTLNGNAEVTQGDHVVGTLNNGSTQLVIKTKSGNIIITAGK